MSDATYKMEFTCSNCGMKFEKQLPKGVPAKGNGGECRPKAMEESARTAESSTMGVSYTPARFGWCRPKRWSTFNEENGMTKRYRPEPEELFDLTPCFICGEPVLEEGANTCSPVCEDRKKMYEIDIWIDAHTDWFDSTDSIA